MSAPAFRWRIALALACGACGGGDEGGGADPLRAGEVQIQNLGTGECVTGPVGFGEVSAAPCAPERCGDPEQRLLLEPAEDAPERYRIRSVLQQQCVEAPTEVPGAPLRFSTCDLPVPPPRNRWLFVPSGNATKARICREDGALCLRAPAPGGRRWITLEPADAGDDHQSWEILPCPA